MAGDVRVTEQAVSELEKHFERTEAATGYVLIESSKFSTAGPIFDIDGEFQFDGSVDVTIPYNESKIGSLPESEMRFLHYDGHKWEDATVFIDTVSNTVTGKVSSLSPVVAAVVEDGTFGQIYFDQNPLSKIQVLASKKIVETSPLQRNTVTISSLIKNIQRINQTYSFIMKVIDKQGATVSLTWQGASISPGSSVQISQKWIPEKDGSYSIQIFVWDGFTNNPSALSKVTVVSE